MKKLVVTPDNIEEIRDMLPSDQADELQVGCETWNIYYSSSFGGDDDYTGHMTYWPETGRAAICMNADSIWGDWDGDLLWTELEYSSGKLLRYDVNGDEVRDDDDEEDVLN